MSKLAIDALSEALLSGSLKVVDLTVTLDAATPTLQLPEEFGWGKSWPFSKELISRYDEKGPFWYWNNFKCGEHTGTHFDAPIHWVTGKDHEDHATDTLPPDKFVGPAVVLDATEQVKSNSDYLLSLDFINSWEAEHGEIPPGAWVLYRTDWSKKATPEEYLNMKEDGGHTPGWDPEAVAFLAEERDIIGVGTETVGTDAGQAPAQEPSFPCHNIMHGANKCGLASLCNLDQLPTVGSVLIAAPLKIKEGSGSPVRVIALAPCD